MQIRVAEKNSEIAQLVFFTKLEFSSDELCVSTQASPRDHLGSGFGLAGNCYQRGPPPECDEGASWPYPSVLSAGRPTPSVLASARDVEALSLLLQSRRSSRLLFRPLVSILL